MNKNIEKSLQGSVIMAIITLSIPILISSLLQSAYQLIDAFWVGQLGGSAIAAVSISFPILFLMTSLGMGFSIAGSTLIAQYTGAKNQKMVNHVSAQTILMIVMFSIILGIIGYIFSPNLLSIMGVDTAVFNQALSFMRYSFMGLPFIFGFSMFQSIMRSTGEIKVPLYIILGTVILNFILDPLLMYGYGIIPELGVGGVALATLFTQGLAAIIGMRILLSKKYQIQLSMVDFKPDFEFIKKTFFLGLPVSIEMSTRGLSLIVMTFLITAFGTVALASYGIISTVLNIVIIPAMGISMAITILVGQNIGAGNLDRAEEIGKKGAMLSFVLLFIVGILSFLFAGQLVQLFVKGDIPVVEGAKHILQIVSLSFGFLGLQFAINGILRASGNMKTSLYLTLISQWGVQLPMAYLLSKNTSLGIDGIWYALPINNLIVAIASIYIFMKGNWKNTKITENDKIIEKVSEETILEEGIK